VIDEHSSPVPDSVIDSGGKVVSWAMPRALEFVGFPPGDFAFDASYRYVVDWEFWYRLSLKYAVSWKLHEATVLVRWHTASETHRFKTGTDDLEETARLLDSIFQPEDHGKPAAARSRKLANRRLSRAFLNRSHEALCNGQADLARTCLGRAWALSSAGVIRTLGTDPRLCAQMTTLVVTSRLASRWFAR
jgi:hypothetical protein